MRSKLLFFLRTLSCWWCKTKLSKKKRFWTARILTQTSRNAANMVRKMSPYVLSEFPPKHYALWLEQDPHPLIIFIIHPPDKKDFFVGVRAIFLQRKKTVLFFWCTWKTICYEFPSTWPLKPAIQLLKILGTFLRFRGSSSFTKTPSILIRHHLLGQFFNALDRPPEPVTISSHFGPCNKSLNLFCSY